MKTLKTKSLLAALGLFAMESESLQAATRAKEDNADNLNLASSWTNNVAPGTADVALFNNTVVDPTSVALGADLSWNQLSFADPGGDFTILPGNTLTLSNNTPIVFGAGSVNLTLNCGLVCAGTGFSTLPSAPAGRAVTYGGVIRGRSATVTLGNSTGTLRIAGTNTSMIGTNVQVNTTGLKFGIGASSTGFPIVSAGPLGTNLFIWAASSLTTELSAYDGAQTLGNNLRISFGPLAFNSSNDLTFTGLVDLNGGNRTIFVTNSGRLRFTGNVANGTGITKTGPGVLELGGTNSAPFGNGLSVFGGTVRLLTDNVIPHGATAGTLRMTNTTEILDLNGFSETINGMAGSGGGGSCNGTIDNAAAGTTSILTVGDQFTYTMTGRLQNSGANAKLALVKLGTGGLVLSNANTFAGGITNADGGQVFLNTTGAAGVGTLAVTTTNAAAEFVYSGGGAISWTNPIYLDAGSQPTISINDGGSLNVSGVISGPGQLWRSALLGKRGSLTISADNRFTGGFVWADGFVTFSHPRAAGRGLLSIGHPSLYTGSQLILFAATNLAGGNAITNAVMINRDFTVGGMNAVELAGPVAWLTNATQKSINVTNPAGVVISGPMGGYGLNKTGVGLLTINGPCSHYGPTTVSTGPLAFGPSAIFTGPTVFLVGGGGSLDVSAMATFTVKADQSLRVDSGSEVAGNVTINGALTNNAFFASVIFSNNLTLGAGSTSVFTINRFNQPGTNLVCLGTLSFGGTLLVNNFGDPLLLGDTFKLFEFAGNPGAFATLNLPPLDPGLAWDAGSLAVNGTITVVSAGGGLQISQPTVVNGTNLVLSVSGGTPNGTFHVLTQTNVAEPMVNWSPVSTNQYDAGGNLTVTNILTTTEPQRFFRIVEP